MRQSRASPAVGRRADDDDDDDAVVVESEIRAASVDNRVVDDLGGGAGGFDFPRISMTTFVVGSDASKELKS